jgi:DNA polymerase-3 subunit gamma/tau
VPASVGSAQPASPTALPRSAATALHSGAGAGGDGTASPYAAVAGGAQRAAHALRHDPRVVESIAPSHEAAAAPAVRDAVVLTTLEPAAAPEPASAPVPAATAVPAGRLRSLADVAALAAERRAIDLKHAVETQLRPVRFEPGHIEVELARGAPVTLAGRLGARLTEWTGERWIVSVVSGGGAATLAEAAREEARLRERDARGHPLVQAVLARFPGAEIVDVRINEPAEAEGMLDAPPDDDQTGPDDD